MKFRSTALLCSLLLALAPGLLRATDTGVLNTTFVPKIFNGGRVDITASTADGTMYVGGGFDWINGQPADWLVKFNKNGSLDSGFNPTKPSDAGNVLAIAPQADGKVLVGYEFSIRVYAMAGATSGTGGIASPPLASNYPTGARMVRFNSDGTLDSTFQTVDLGQDWATYPSTAVLSFIVPLSSRKILVGGGFASINGTAIAFLGTLNADGTVDKTFKTTVDGAVETALLAADGGIVIGGNFTKIDKIRLSFGLAKLRKDGKRDASFIAQGKPKARHIAKLAAGLGKTLLAATETDSLVRDGQQVTQPKSHIEVFEGNGKFQRTAATNITGAPVGLMQYTVGNALLVSATNPNVQPVVVSKPAKVTGPGFAAFVNLSPKNTKTSSGVRVSYAVAKVVPLSYRPIGIALRDNTLLAFGQGGLDPDTTPSMGGFEVIPEPGHPYQAPPIWVGSSAIVAHIAASPGAKLLVSGSFTFGLTSDGALVDRQGLAKLDTNGFVDATFAPAKASIIRMLANADGGLTAVGTIETGTTTTSTTTNSYSGNTLFQLTSSGDLDSSFTISDDAHQPVLTFINALVRQQDGMLVVGGMPSSTTNSFPSNAVESDVLRRFKADGTPDSNFAPTFANSAKNNWGYTEAASVKNLQVDSDGALLVSGTFNAVNGVAHTSPVRMLIDGTVDASAFAIATPGGFAQVLPRAGGYLFTAPQLNDTFKVIIPPPGLAGTNPIVGTVVSNLVTTNPVLAGSGSITLTSGAISGVTISNSGISNGGGTILTPITPSDPLPAPAPTSTPTAAGAPAHVASASKKSSSLADLVHSISTGQKTGSTTHSNGHSTSPSTPANSFSNALSLIYGGTSKNTNLTSGTIQTGNNTLTLGASIGSTGNNLVRISNLISGGNVNLVSSGSANLVNSGAIDSVSFSSLTLNSNMVIAIPFPNPNGGDGMSPFLATVASGAADSSFSVADLVPAGTWTWRGQTYGVKLNCALPNGSWAAMTYGLKDQKTDTTVSLVIINADGSLNRTYAAPVFASDPNQMYIGIAWWGPQAPADFVNDMIALDDGSIIVAGSFWSVNGEARNGLARLNPAAP